MKFIYIIALCLFGLNVSAAQLEVTSVAAGNTIQGQGYYSVDFGTVLVNMRTVSRFNLKNTGNVPLTFKEAYIYGNDFTGSHACRNGLLPNETCSFTLAYWPMFEGTSTGRFVLSFNEDNVVFDLWGRAVRQ